jgi:hypothetical protein
MAQTKMLSLIAPATFKYTVNIPRPGDTPAPVEFEFKHRRKDDLRTFVETVSKGEMSDQDLLMDIVVNWNGPDKAFSPEAMNALRENYPMSARAVWDGYLEAFFNPQPRS